MSGQKNHSEIFKIDGVGVNLSRFHPCALEEKNALRAEFGYSENAGGGNCRVIFQFGLPSFADMEAA